MNIPMIGDLVKFITSLISGIFKAENSAMNGIDKEMFVLGKSLESVSSVANPLGYIKWVLLGIKIIRKIIEILNSDLGHDWGKNNANQSK